MKKVTGILVPLVCLLIATGCTKSFESLNQNPNKPYDVSPSLLFNGILNDLYDAPYSNKEKWNQYYLINYDYYGNNRYDFTPDSSFYTTIKSSEIMGQLAARKGGEAINPYAALGKFFKAYFYTKMSLQVGDIPMDSAVQGLANLTPKYNTQKEVFLQAFKWLEEANSDLATLVATASSNTTEGQVLKGDIYFGNNLSRWQKVINTFRIRLLIELSKKSGDADLKIAEQFAMMFSIKAEQYPMMESMDDNLQYTYVHPTNDYPNNPGNFGFDALRYNASATYTGLLTQLKDPRVFVTMEPASALVAGGMSPVSFDAFAGANAGEDLGTMYTKTNAGQYSLINRHRYYDTYTGEPSIQIGYPELCFNIAEAINRGWITGNAEDYYIKGIRASMSFYGIPESGVLNVYFLHPGASLGTYDNYTVNIDFNDYYNNQASVKYNGNNATGLTQILQQKYLAMFRHSGLEAYYQFRRTGIPAFQTGPGTGNSQRIALRFPYPLIERTANAKNYADALNNQYAGNDDINGIMWILK
ncbi:MAG: SusD/RagB family nutrient-binding outer membrane lipoprotein [Chitinophagaceae bacterium]|nr:SusD/RagB family nutrient-binding outer membrane lipoprotein [Chitinophagaceae bacterium]